MKRKIRVLTFEMPRMLSEIVTARIAEEGDMEAVETAIHGGTLTAAVEESNPDVVVLLCRWNEVEKIGAPALRRRPALKILALTAEGRSAALCSLRPHTRGLGPASLQTLVSAIREVAGS